MIDLRTYNEVWTGWNCTSTYRQWGVDSTLPVEMKHSSQAVSKLRNFRQSHNEPGATRVTGFDADLTAM